MILEGAISVPADQQTVWDSIWDVKTLASWVPGCSSVEQVDDETYRVHLEQQISMFKASFELLLRVTESDPPNSVVITGQGEDKRMGSNLQLHTVVQLSPEGAGSTTMRYRHDLSVFGKLGALGFPLIQRKAREAETEFAARARRHFTEARAAE